MCGLAGLVLAPPTVNAESLTELAVAMRDSMRHRGPDDAGVWVDPAAGVALGHRRLSILDPSPDGHQPMASMSGRYILAYNGEIYNFRALRSELQALGARFRSASDTEVMLAAFEAWGPRTATARFRGIFAYALWDGRDRTLTLCRDHVGVKPLCYAFTRDGLLFASEVRALERVPGFDRTLDRDAVAALLRFNCVPAPLTIYGAARKLPPGTLGTWTPGQGPSLTLYAYWSAQEIARAGTGDPLRISPAEAVERLAHGLEMVVQRQMVSDVPLGAFLSGGVDSSIVVALMQRQGGRVRTFSIGSGDPDYDEAHHAAAVARHLGTEHTELVVTASEALAVVPHLAEIFDEPFSDSSQIPTYLVSALARQDVTVALSGDGGDELFGGYDRHVFGERLWSRLQTVPLPLRRGAGRALGSVTPSTWQQWAQLVPPMRSAPRLGDRLHKLMGLLDAPTAAAIYGRLVSHWQHPSDVVIGAAAPESRTFVPVGWPVLPSFTEQMMAHDMVSYLPDDILVKLDRASMAVSLEARVPLLDPDIIELAWRLPMETKLREGVGKWVLRQVLYRHVDRSLVDRPKTGFAVPIGAWLRGPLRDWAETLLEPSRLRQDGVFVPAPIAAAWKAHLAGQGGWAHRLWDILMFQAWFESRRGR